MAGSDDVLEFLLVELLFNRHVVDLNKFFVVCLERHKYDDKVLIKYTFLKLNKKINKGLLGKFHVLLSAFIIEWFPVLKMIIQK